MRPFEIVSLSDVSTTDAMYPEGSINQSALDWAQMRFDQKKMSTIQDEFLSINFIPFYCTAKIGIKQSVSQYSFRAMENK